MLLLTFLATTAVAGTLDQPWRTVETEHFRLHYPIEAEAWALESAAQLEDIRARVAVEIGYAPDHVVDIVVMDPNTQSNGFALPWINGPRMGVYATPPNADSILGNYRSWEEDLIVHEDAHVVHMTIPSRNPWVHLFVDRAIGAGPVTMKSGRWVFEGYATVVEGRLTGLGRPNSDGRALWLRQMAREGRMPSYWELDGSQAWRGGSYAYIVGSAYLEWLELQQGEGALRDLWTALSAHKQRDFNESFMAVFGEAPDVLYSRFVAELARDALLIEAARPVQEGTIWQDLWGSTGAPTLSKDGEKLAAVVRPEIGPARLVVWSTGENEEPLAEWQEAVDAALEKDPEDITPVQPEVFPREPEHERVRPDRAASEPRWTPDDQLLFAAWFTAPDGRRVPDLVLWNPEGGERRVTRGGSLHSPDPHPDGARAIAVRQAWSASQLVWVDLEGGEWTAITEPDVNAVLDQPRISPDGSTLAYLRNVDGWALVLRDLASGAEREVALPEGGQVAQPAWAPDSSGLYASVGVGGFIEAWFLPATEGAGPARQLTSSRGGVAAPEPTPGGDALYYLSMDVEGRDLHRVSITEPAPETAPFVVSPPVLRPPRPPAIDPPTQVAVTPEPFRLGGLSASPMAGTAMGPGRIWADLGVRVGDVAGRNTLHLQGGFDDARSWGLSAAYATRALPVTLTVSGLLLNENFDGGDFLRNRAIGELSLSRTFTGADTTLSLMGGGWVDAALPDSDGRPLLASGFLSGSLRQTRWLSQVWLGYELAGDIQYGQRKAAIDDSEWLPLPLYRPSLTLEGGWWPVGVALHGESTIGNARIGGLPTSLYPAGWAAGNQTFVPVLPVNYFVNSGHRAGSVAITAPGGVSLSARVDHGTVDEATYKSPRNVHHIALQSDTPVAAQPIAKISDLRLQAGVACVFDDYRTWWGDRECRELDDYRAWLGVSWRP